ncbi:hypothetical protein IR083_12485, partial [Dysgonomonas sp. GY75]|uniref:hypothetical protein n=1 Tax=Dysgonomonas sp. GY75 TaxID=2780419 RepID=UPI001883B436
GLSLRTYVNNTTQAFQTWTLTTRRTLLFLMAALPSSPLSPFCGDGRSRIHRRAGGEWTAGRTLTCRGEAAGCIKNKYIQYFICDFLKNRTICSNLPGWRGDAVGDRDSACPTIFVFDRLTAACERRFRALSYCLLSSALSLSPAAFTFNNSKSYKVSKHTNRAMKC